MAGLFSIGVSGLRAQQAALNIVGQNITNANTPGYSRQRADIVTQTSGANSGASVGAGVTVGGIRRIADGFIDDQIRSDAAAHAELSSFTSHIKQLESTLFDGQFGIDSALRDFFDAVQSASTQPSDLAMREFVISTAEALASRFQGVTDRSWLQARDILGSLESSVVRVNELSSLVVQLNERISGLQDERSSGALNLMLDRREVLLKELSSLVSVRTVEQDDGQISVFVGKGQPLILGAEAAQMQVTGDGDIAVQPVGSRSLQIVTSSISGGEIGGVLKYREEVLWPTQNEIGRLAAAISIAVNAQHQLGIDLEGNFGGDVFRDVNDPALVSQRVDYLGGSSQGNNVDIGRVNVYIDDPFNVEATDYEVHFSETNAGSYTISRRSTGETVFHGSSLVTPQEVFFDGLRVEFASGEFAPGDTFLLRPYADFGTQMDTVLNDPSLVALGSALQVGSNPNNQGNGEFLVTDVIDPSHPVFNQIVTDNEEMLTPPLLVRFLSATEYVVLDNSNPSQPTPLQPDLGIQTYLSGSENHLFPQQLGSSLVTTSGPGLGGLAAAPSLVSNLDAGTNGYPNGTISLNYANSTFDESERIALFTPNATAREIASQLNSLPGVSASAQTTLTLQDLVNFESGTPVELAVNGQLITGFANLAELADAISANQALVGLGITAKSDGQTLVLNARYGDDITLHFQGDPNESVMVLNSKGEQVNLNGNTPGVYRSVTVGGEVSTILAPGIELEAQYVGIFAANPVHARADMGFDLVLSGSVASGDEFFVNFNQGGIGDNRNALALASLSDQSLIGDPARPFADMFASVIQRVGIQSSQASISREAAGILLSQSEVFRESVSGVNLDEEAASLIQHEQAYNASAQIISVARDLFNVLLNSVS